MNESLRSRLKVNTWSLVGAVASLVILELVTPYQGAVVLLVGLGGALLSSYLWVQALARGLSVSREIRFGWAQVGDRLEERLTLINNSWTPALWLEIIDHSTLPGYNISSATGIDARSNSHRLAHGTCSQRGAFTLGPTTFRTGDPFGVFTLTLESSSVERMIVLPPVVPLPGIEIASGGRAREGRRRASANEPTVNAASTRDYSPGDSLHLIHWRTVARRDELFVRELDSTPSGDWWIFLDLNEQAQVGRGQQSTLEHGIICAASLATRGLHDGHTVGLVALGDELAWLSPRGGESQRWEILHALALARTGKRTLADLLAHGEIASKRTASIIVITSDVNGNWIDALLPYIWRGCVPTVLLFDPVSFGGAQDVRPVASILTELEITHYTLQRAMLDGADTMPGKQGKLDWRITPRGRAIPSRTMHEVPWRVLG